MNRYAIVWANGYIIIKADDYKAAERHAHNMRGWVADANAYLVV